MKYLRIVPALLLLSLFLTECQVSADDATEPAPPVLSVPIACEPRKTCFIQSYVDTIRGPERGDYACGSATQDEHKGTDFRVLSAAVAEKGVAVLAAADGTVKARRDAMPDQLVAEGDKDGIKGRECGNGVVLDHGHGWETQYCHMRRGSVGVDSGQLVRRGQRLGDVGYSGLAQFAHLHFEVRHDGKVIDPFSGRTQNEACDRDTRNAKDQWDEAFDRAFQYANGEIISAVFTNVMPEVDALERSDHVPAPHRASPQLLFVARFMNLRAKDRVRLEVTGPNGFALTSTTEPLDRDKATYVAYAGKRLSQPMWASGSYNGTVRLIRGQAVVGEARAEVRLMD
jgi:hypothetical protein